MTPHWRLQVFWAAVVVWICLANNCTAQLSQSWVRKSPQNHGVIVFVHGILGDDKSTWTNGKAYWPEMLTHDHRFDGQDIYVFRYTSPLLGQAFSLDQITESMQSHLQADGVFDYKEMTFVSHSMGGIVTRELILRYRELAPKVRLLYFYATPTTGNSYAYIAKLFSRNSQFKQLLSINDPSSFLATQQSQWIDAKLQLKSYCAYETQTVAGFQVVERDSASNLCSEHIAPIDANHINIVKPANMNSEAYVVLAAAFVATAKKSSQPKEVKQTANKFFIVPIISTFDNPEDIRAYPFYLRGRIDHDEVLNPVTSALYLSIKNTSNAAMMIDGIDVSVQLEQNEWSELQHMSGGIDKWYFQYGDLTKGYRIGIIPLEQSLYKNIQPGETVFGWSFWSLPKRHTFVERRRRFRIVVTDSAQQKFTYETPLKPTNDSGLGFRQPAGFMKTGIVDDLSAIPIRIYGQGK